ncbi:MAG: hypothetical protein HOP17_07710 [Acidobacteria bacterium]|nr:hypothetical protein [Acidobacteriota bacterium]
MISRRSNPTNPATGGSGKKFKKCHGPGSCR